MVPLVRLRSGRWAKWQPTLGTSFRALASRNFSTSTGSRDGQPFRVAIVGSGPAGFYTAYRTMSKIQGAKVDMYEALPVPFGLVRFGVAPDHPEVKNCQEKFEEVASSPNFTFIGNVSIGSPSDHPDGGSIPLASILRHYHAVVFSYGAAKDRTLGIPGESTLKGVYSAREFVGWYNGLPEHADLAPDLTQGDEAVIIGQGNVALDVARMLLEDVNVLRKSDIAEHAIEALSRSKVKRIHIVGRRGPMQAAFTIKEVRELMRLPSVAFHPVDRALVPADLTSLPRAPRRLMDVLLKGSAARPSSETKSWSLDFLLAPKAFLPAPSSSPSRLASTSFERTSLSPSPFDPKAYPLATGETLELPSSVAFRSIGYKSEPLPEFASLGIPFNDRWGVISNDGQGRVLHEERTADRAMSFGNFPGLYCAGWVKRGPTGVIASTMEDAFGTADAMAGDWGAGRQFLNEGDAGMVTGWEGVKGEVAAARVKARVVDWPGWRRIDEAERKRGRAVGKEREKFTRTEDMLAVLG
ncbi:putative NADPH:adrenodoxin oxidoreductase, mitochondrial [Madurella mycetomatis]|uniref:NADPH:adrenodoxin oxidoreductase, mitochondrial n=1 Tax=Madurella mycetomatis TaxID=100816 RepID=A0A150ASQ8_9PEZI|nr:putative NADPH:adrenodoxin oxidoreductase, mitochondrial [Madurella mycetomatis]